MGSMRVAIVYWPLLVADFWGDKVNVQNSMVYELRSPRTGRPRSSRRCRPPYGPLIPRCRRPA